MTVKKSYALGVSGFLIGKGGRENYQRGYFLERPTDSVKNSEPDVVKGADC